MIAISGGSYNYLYCQDVGLIPDALARMAERLAGLPYAGTAAADTAEIVKSLERITELADRLSSVWHAIEWWDSGDRGEDQTRLVVEHYNTCACKPKLSWSDGSRWALECTALPRQADTAEAN